MSATTLKSFRLSQEEVKKIQTWSKEEQITQAEFLRRLLDSYEILRLNQQYEEDLKRMAQDKAYQKQQQKQANEFYL